MFRELRCIVDCLTYKLLGENMVKRLGSRLKQLLLGKGFSK